MSEQLLRLGDQYLKLDNPDASVEPIVAESAEWRRLEEDQVRWASIQASREPLLQDGLETLTAAPFSQYAEAFMSFFENGEALNPATAETLKARLKGQLVFDVGSGLTPEKMQHFVNRFGAKAYLGVDVAARFGEATDAYRVDGLGDAKPLAVSAGSPIDGSLIRGDMLRVASRLPDESASIALMGIDDYIVTSGSPYSNRMVEELARIIHPRGVIFGIQGMENGLLTELAGRPEIQVEETSVPVLGIYLLTKRA